MMAAHNASSHTFSERNKALIPCTANGFETPHSIVLRNNLFMNPGEKLKSQDFSETRRIF